ncbi:cAMP-dependent protein kinase regulatory subunit [Pseudozyma hubeiensis SY62]|uniref:cAMP-dependent protein kinase regulatory subunit n=1 Tax=Pseudozyma hubeiensis (strain SY62) TaxID=1305764 RepID=R9PAW8_PSEHS|nr:cAMP-dependent protein kinase regulatory subunit [Pseudozyma hubeiensis SY62]GAC98494.1 cAMP-dependent protein kinase regulatory subunit [Pseudozyma hubeiensis SY62]
MQSAPLDLFPSNENVRERADEVRIRIDRLAVLASRFGDRSSRITWAWLTVPRHGSLTWLDAGLRFS